MRNIVLLGFMGTGKSSVAEELAARLNARLISTDRLIEKREGMTINEIFAEKGEPYFRSSEKKVVKEASGMDGVIIDAGGGVVLDKENLDALGRNGVLFCLDARPETIARRTSAASDRPLLKAGDPLTEIRRLLEKRAPYYAAVRHQMDTDGKTAREVADEILRIFHEEE